MTATGVRPIESLRPQLHALEGKDYAAYQSVRGSYAYNRFQLHVEQITEAAQTRAIGRAMDYAKRYMDGHLPLREVVERAMGDVDRSGLDVLDPRYVGELAGFRGLELAAALNRFRGLIFHSLE